MKTEHSPNWGHITVTAIVMLATGVWAGHKIERAIGERPRPTVEVEEMFDPGHRDELYLGDPAEKASTEPGPVTFILGDVPTFDNTQFAAIPAPMRYGLPETCEISYADGATTSWSILPPEGVEREDYKAWTVTLMDLSPEPEPLIQEWIGPAGSYSTHFHTALPSCCDACAALYLIGSHTRDTMDKAVAEEVGRQEAILESREFMAGFNTAIDAVIAVRFPRFDRVGDETDYGWVERLEFIRAAYAIDDPVEPFWKRLKSCLDILDAGLSEFLISDGHLGSLHVNRAILQEKGAAK